MIDFRYHVVSLVAALLALAIAMKGTRLKTITMILNRPRNEYITTVNVSRGMGNQMLCIR